jgi:hypothetical protein
VWGSQHEKGYLNGLRDNHPIVFLLLRKVARDYAADLAADFAITLSIAISVANIVTFTFAVKCASAVNFAFAKADADHNSCPDTSAGVCIHTQGSSA